MIVNSRIPFSYFFHKIKWDLFISAFLSILIYFATTYGNVSFKLPLTFSGLLGTSISLLLSFKLSQSYDRWWEARKIWGTILIETRSLIIQIKNYSRETEVISPALKKITYRQIAWNYALSRSLRKQAPLKHHAHFLDKAEVKEVEKHLNIPLSILDKQTKDVVDLLEKGIINQFQQVQIDQTISNLGTCMGQAERIKNTYFPKTYRVTLHLFIYLFLLSLSFSFYLDHSNVFIYTPLLICIAIPFFLLEKIAVDMQDPFENKPTDTASTAISTTLEINLKQLINDTDVPKPLTTDTFFIM